MRWIKRGLGALLATAVLAALALFGLDTNIGHRFIADQITAQKPQSGLRIRVGRIEGSIYGKAVIRQLTLSDPQGVFLSVPNATLDWRPGQWLRNRLDVVSLTADTAALARLPKLMQSKSKGPILPGYDVHIGALTINKLTLGLPQDGSQNTGRLAGQVDIRAGRALVALKIDAKGGDLAELRLDAQPDRNIFDASARLSAASGGAFGKLIGTDKALKLTVAGNGGWQEWRGKANGIVAGQQVADLGLKADDGQFALNGQLSLASVTRGKLQALSGPVTIVAGTATLVNRRLEGKASARSSAISVEAIGAVDLAANRFDPVTIKAKLDQPAALFRNMSGTDIGLNARLFGAFDAPAFSYSLAAKRLGFGATVFENVKAVGQGGLAASPALIPVSVSAQRVNGVGDVVGGILANLKVNGKLLISSKSINGAGLLLSSDRLSGKLALFVDLKTGFYDVGLAGQLGRYLIPGLGIVDVRSELSAVPGANGGPVRIMGKGQALVRRFDNGFFSGLTGGLPRLETDLLRDAEGTLRFTNLRIYAPGLTFAGSGQRRRDGSFQISGSGRQARYGALDLKLDGPIARPKLDILLAKPSASLGLAAVRLHLDPTAEGFAWRADGGSAIGPFNGQGALLLPKGAAAIIDVARLDVSGVNANGRLAAQTGGLQGRLLLSGQGVSGSLGFEPIAGVQQINAAIKARNARLTGPPLIAAQIASFNGVIRLEARGLAVEGTATGQGLQYRNLTLARLAANINLRDGKGELRAAFAGSPGRAFDLQTVMQISPERLSVIGQGSVDRRPISLGAPAVLTREGEGWRLERAGLRYGGGVIEMAGLFGPQLIDMDAKVANMPLTILDTISPGLGLGGKASGSLTYRQPDNGAPTGKADLRISGLTRSGLVLASRPIDVGVAAVLSAERAGIRAIAVSGGKEIGRVQARLVPDNRGDLLARLSNASVEGQLRYSGSADTLWRLTGVNSFDVSGPIMLGADVSGRVNQPLIRGQLRTDNARIESPVTGLELTNVKASGRFAGGSRFTLDSFSAVAGKEGSISGSGSFDLASANGFGIDLALNAQQASILARDDLAATVTGPIRIQSDGDGGLISADLTLNRSRYRLGRSSAAQAVPRLKVREVNGFADAAAAGRRASPWRLAIKARADDRVTVTGLGLTSEWRANLQIGGSAYSPVLSGRADLLNGDYEFAGRQFDVTRGSIRFQGEDPPDPVVDITAEGDTQGLNASIRVTGTGLRPDIRFASTPTLPEDELLSRLLFGTSITNLSAPEALQLGAAVASLRNGGNGLNPINALRKAVGLDRLRILPADTITGQKTAIAAGKYLSRRAFVELVTDGQGYSATRAEFQVTRWLSILSSISTIGRQSAAIRVSRDY